MTGDERYPNKAEFILKLLKKYNPKYVFNSISELWDFMKLK